jgi:hypothetical protein
MGYIKTFLLQCEQMITSTKDRTQWLAFRLQRLVFSVQRLTIPLHKANGGLIMV